jgi:DNA invertase Pin-like site-specific DNA recombinase
MDRVVAYVRVSTADQAESRAGLEAQRAAILAEAQRRGWSQVQFVEDAGFSAQTMRRPGMQIALDLLRRGEANVLIVAKVDRLSRSLLDFLTLMNLAADQGWHLVSLDLVDTTTPAGRMMARVVAVFGEFERELGSARTREALAARRAAGVRLGRPTVLAEATEAEILRMRSTGMPLRAIADSLTERGVPTAHGGARWHASTVRSVERRLTGSSQSSLADEASQTSALGSAPDDDGTTEAVARAIGRYSGDEEAVPGATGLVDRLYHWLSDEPRTRRWCISKLAASVPPGFAYRKGGELLGYPRKATESAKDLRIQAGAEAAAVELLDQALAAEAIRPVRPDSDEFCLNDR